jgi:hypothetical protein
MAKMAINLLPQEFRLEELKRAKFFKIQTVGVGVILFMALLASVSVGLRILQSQNITSIQENLADTEQRVLAHKDVQGSLLLLKNRLTAVGKYLEVPSEGVYMYGLISKLIPSTVTINSMSIGRDGEILVLAVSKDSTALDELFNNLTSQETNEGKIKEVSMENLSRGRDGIYRINFTVKPNKP